MAISDNPIRVESQDLYGRVPFAANLAHLLLSFPDDSSYCVGLYGDWGSGKTSVLEIVAGRIKSDNQHVIWLTPWALGSAENVLEHLLGELVRELDIRCSTGGHLLSKAMTFLSNAAQAGEGLDFRVTIALRTARPALDRVARNLKLKHGENLLNRVAVALEGKRVIVFVDDLDRTPSRDVPDILLTLHEAMSLPGIHYVVALSPTIVREGLQEARPEWNRDPQDFLDKIVEYPLSLVAPSKNESLAAAHVLARAIPSFPNPNILDDLIDYLPSNPRRLKLFLRLVDSLSIQLNRFSPEELDYKRALLIQMLRVEFPSESLALFHDEAAVEEIESDFLKKIGDNSTSQEEPDRRRAEETHAPKDTSRRERFLMLCEGVRKRNLRSDLTAADLFFLIDRPVLLTRKELHEMLEKITTHDIDAREVAGNFLGIGDDSERVSRIAVLWEKLIEGRDRVLAAAAARDSQEQLREELTWVKAIDSLVTTLVDDIESFGDGGLGADAWRTLRNHVLRWHRFINIAEYPPLREKERLILRDVSRRLAHREQAIIWMRRQSTFPSEDPDEALKRELDRIYESFAIATGKLALARFSEYEGVDILWDSHTETPERLVLLEPNSPFHAPELRGRLEELATKATADPIIHQNFLTYLRALLYGATKSNPNFSKCACRTLCSDKNFLQLLWKAAVSHPLNPRVVGSLREQMEKASSVNIPVDSLEKPKWWTAMEEAVFSVQSTTG